MTSSTVDIPVSLVPGDSCADCAGRLETALLGHRGIAGVQAGRSGWLTVTYDSDLCNLECLTQAATDVGLELERTFAHLSRSVEGMDCYDCAQTIEKAAARIEGVMHCRVNFAAARMSLEYDTAHPQSAAAVEKVVGQLGYRLKALPERGAQPATPAAGEESAPAPAWAKKHLAELVTAFSAAATLAAIFTDASGGSLAARILYSMAVVSGGASIARSGIRAVIATRRLDINFLMTIAVIGAMTINAWLEAALVVVLFRIGENLEYYAVDRARKSLETLLSLAPQFAHRRVVSDSGEVQIEDVAASSLAIDDSVSVRPGETFPSDGQVLEGQSSVNQASITGESIPVDKVVGSQIFAGTINGEGSVVVQVTNAPGDSTLDRVARAVEEAQSQRSPAERWVNSFARVYTPLVLIAAVLVAVVPPLFFGQEWSEWIYRGLAFLILSCPCALVIATPVSVVAALARSSQAGVLVKGGAFLEAATKLRAIATDKTGTLTLGAPFVTENVAFGRFTESEVLRLAAAVDAASEHPLARAIVSAAAEAGLEVPAATEFESIRGYGARAVVGGLKISVGNERLIADHPLFDEIKPTIDDMAGRGVTIVAVTSEDEIVGVLGIADRIRPEAAETFRQFQRFGVEHTILLTGDHQGAANAIAAQAGITDLRANLLPGDKVKALDEIQAQFGPTAMIGDGVNDAPALAKSALGIAMGGAGSPTAIETADVILMGDDLRKLGGFFALAAVSRKIVRQNIAFSLATKAVAASFALVGLLPLWLAVMADVGATLLVVANGLRLLRCRLDPPLEVTAPADGHDVVAPQDALPVA